MSSDIGTASESEVQRLIARNEELENIRARLEQSERSKRHLLPQRRFSETFELKHDNQNDRYIVTIGRYADGNIGEVFITGQKAGSNVEAVARDGAVLLSIALQFGVPLEVIKGAITRNSDGSPSTIVGAVIERLTAL